MNRFDELFKAYNRDVYRLAYSYVLNKSDAEDITQKTFYKLYINIKKLKISDIEVKKWLFKVTVNESKNLLKSSWYKLFRKSISSNIENEAGDTHTDSIEELENISEKYRIPLYLFYHEGYSIKEISEIMSKTEGAVKMLLARGRKELKKEMEGDK